MGERMCKKIKVSLLDAIGNLAVTRIPREKKQEILKEASKCRSLEEEIKYILRRLEEVT